MDWRKALHPLMLKTMSSIRKLELVRYSDCYNDFSKPTIFAVNHTNSHDIPIACEIIKNHVYVFAGSENLRIVDRLVFILNGVCFVQRKNKKSREKSKNRLIKMLNSGKNIMIFPEATWNLTENKLMLPMYWGVIDIAQQTGSQIIPIVLDYNNSECIYSIGKGITIDNYQTKEQAISLLRDKMSTMRYEIWASKSIERRTDDLKNTFYKQIKHDLDEYPLLDIEFEKSIILDK